MHNLGVTSYAREIEISYIEIDSLEKLMLKDVDEKYVCAKGYRLHHNHINLLCNYE